MPNIGPLEIIIVLVIVLIIFGPKRLPDLGRSLGSGMRNFKDSVTGRGDDEEVESRPELTGTQATQPPVEARSQATQPPVEAHAPVAERTDVRP